MTSRAHAEFDPSTAGIRLTVSRGTLPAPLVLLWGDIELTTVDEAIALPARAWLRLPEEDARAIYEALAEHFGHTGHDMRALRNDYDAERRRVDKFITHLTGSP